MCSWVTHKRGNTMAEDGKSLKKGKSLAIRQRTEPVEVSYSPSFQGKAINAFSSISPSAVKEKAVEQWKKEQSKKPIAEQQSLFPGEGYKTPVLLVRGEVLFTVPPWVVFTGRTIQVIRYIIEKFTKAVFQSRFLTPEERKACRTVELTIKEVGKKFDMSDPKAIRAMLNTEINALYEVSAEWMEYVYVRDEKTGKKIKPQEATHFTARLIGKKADTVPITGDTVPVVGEKLPAEIENKKADFFKRGKATVTLTEEMAEYLQNSYIFHIADNFYKIQPKKNPYSVAFYDEIITCYRNNMNKIKDNAKEQEENTVIIKVVTLLAKTDIPKYEDIAKDGRVNQKIFAKLERDMDKLQELGLIEKWRYCKTNGVELSMAEKEKMTYKQFEKYNVKVTMPDNYPRFNTISEEPTEES